MTVDKLSKKPYGFNQIYIQFELEKFFEAIHETPSPSHFSYHPSNFQNHSSMVDISFALIDPQFLKTCCPFLVEICTLLGKAKIQTPISQTANSNNLASSNINKPTIRKITPKVIPSPQFEDQRNQTQNQLRKLFFLSQPQLQQLSELVYEKVMSNTMNEIMRQVSKTLDVRYLKNLFFF